MDSRPSSLLPLLPLLLTSLLNFWPCATGQSLYIIDTVSLAVLPSSTVQSGTHVTLRCQVIVSHDNIPNLTHTFQLTRDDFPVHYSTTTEDSVMFELSPARAADSGNYECRVTVRDKSKVSFSQKLDVTGLQTPILYLNKTEPYEREEFTATCSAPEEKGPLTFRFFQKFRTGEPTKMKQIASNGNSSETTLILWIVGDSRLYCDYEINLVSGIRNSNRSSEIPVIVKALHITPVMNVRNSSKVYEGDDVEVFCKVVSHLKNIEVFLTKDHRILKQAPVSLNHRFTAKAGDSGALMCKAEWGNVQKETYQIITVQELFSEPRLSVQPIDIFEGQLFKLTCSISIYVPERINNGTVRFSMYRDGVRLNSANTYSALAHPSKNGNYTCKAQAALNVQYIVKESQTVVIEAKVPVSKPVLSVVGGTLVLGRRFQLLCQSDIGTLPIVYNLFGPNKLFETRRVSKPGEQAIFNCSAIYKRSDINDFLCHAKNSQHRAAKTDTGQLLASTKIIEPVSQPVLSMLPGMRDVSEGQDVTLECSVQSGTLPINFTWYKETEGTLNFEISRKLKASHRIHNVRGEHRGEYYCVSTNPAKEIKESRRITISVKMATWKKVLIAVVCILPILVLVLFVIFKRRLLPFQRKTTGELSVKSASKTERQSLTLAEVNEAANVTPGMIGKSVWSEHVSGSESDDQNSVTSPENPEPEYTEVQTKQADPHRAPVRKNPDTVYSEVRNSMQGVPEAADGGSVEYAQLNHDADHHSNHGNHGDHYVQDDHIDEIDSSVDNSTADQGE